MYIGGGVYVMVYVLKTWSRVSVINSYKSQCLKHLIESVVRTISIIYVKNS